MNRFFVLSIFLLISWAHPAMAVVEDVAFLESYLQSLAAGDVSSARRYQTSELQEDVANGGIVEAQRNTKKSSKANAHRIGRAERLGKSHVGIVVHYQTPSGAERETIYIVATDAQGRRAIASETDKAVFCANNYRSLCE